MVAAAQAKLGVETPKPASETPATPAVETPAADTDVDGAEAEGVLPASEAQDTDDGYSLEEDGFVGARDLAEKLDASEALKAALPAELRNEIMANARLAEVGAQYKELFSSPEEAKVITKTATEYAGLTESFDGIRRNLGEGTTGFLKAMLQATAARDEEGNPVKNADGSYKTDGSVWKMCEEITNRGIASKIISKVEALGDENVQAALDLVLESVGLRPSTADQDQNQDPALTARKAELDQQESRIKQERESSAREQATQYTNALKTEQAALYEGEVGKLLSKATGLDDFTRKAVEDKIAAAFSDALKPGRAIAYHQRLREIKQQPMSPARRERELALAREYTRDNLVRIARPILSEAGIAVGKKVGERQAAQAARAEGARSEVNGGRAVVPIQAGTETNSAQQRAAVAESLKAQNGGRTPDESEITRAIMVAAAQAKLGRIA